MQGNDYGEIFREERERLGWTQKEVAKEIGNISDVSISLRENGERKFKVLELYKAYKIGIDIGFGDVFDCIDDGSINRHIQSQSGKMRVRLSEIEAEDIKEKKYETLKISTIEKLRRVIKSTEEIEVTVEERERLLKVLTEYKKKEGNIEGALKVLENGIELTSALTRLHKILEEIV